MMNKFNNTENFLLVTVICLIFLNGLFLSGCLKDASKPIIKTYIINPPPRIHGATVVPPRCTATTNSYEYLERTHGSFTDPDTGLIYEVVLDTQTALSHDHYDAIYESFHKYYTANDVAIIAWQLTKAWEEKFEKDPDLYGKTTDVITGVMNIHVIIAQDQLHLKQIFNDLHTVDKNFLGKMIVDRPICFQTPGTRFTMVLIPESFVVGNPAIIAHEIAHMVSYAGKGDTNPDHSDPDIWMAKDKKSSIQAMAIQGYQLHVSEPWDERRLIESSPSIIDVHTDRSVPWSIARPD